MLTLLRLYAVFQLTVVVLAALPVGSHAHFSVNAKNRIIIVDRTEGNLNLYLRVPAPLIYARELSERAASGDRVKAPFLSAEYTRGTWLHRLDLAAIQTTPSAFGKWVASGYRITVNGMQRSVTVTAVAVQQARTAPPFSTPKEALSTLRTPQRAESSPYVGEAVIDIALHVDNADADGDVFIASTLPILTLPQNVYIDNHILDYSGSDVRTLNVPGQMQAGVLIDRSTIRNMTTFITGGIQHIMAGPDHVLFVLCLTMAASSIGMLLWNVTGFTLGHSVTLIAGFLGFTPAYAWFVPAVETAIAVSIVYTGLMVLLGCSWSRGWWVTTMIGLLHGFGFSFALTDILGPDAPNLVLSLLSFNIGVEIGQLLIVSGTWLILFSVKWAHRRLAIWVRAATAAGSIGMACIWAVERFDLLAGAI